MARLFGGEFLRRLQWGIIETLDELCIPSHTPPGRHGVWGRTGQLAALGVAVRGGVTYYGVYLNVCPPLGLFRLVDADPQGHTAMSSLAAERRGAGANGPDRAGGFGETSGRNIRLRPLSPVHGPSADQDDYINGKNRVKIRQFSDRQSIALIFRQIENYAFPLPPSPFPLALPSPLAEAQRAQGERQPFYGEIDRPERLAHRL